MSAYFYFIAKAMHLIGMVSWMAGLFYLVRIMVYHATALTKDEPERGILSAQYELMEGKVYKVILIPAVVITWVFGVLLLVITPHWLLQIWMHFKLALLLLLTAYTWYCKTHIKLLAKGDTRYDHLYYRALNEVPTVLMVGIIFLAVFKMGINFIYLSVGLTLFVGLIAMGIRGANRKKANN